jgi:hypothetical protein
MKTIPLVLFLALSFVTLRAEDFTTTDGKKFSGVKISRIEPDGIVVVTDSGVVKLPFLRLSEDIRKKYGYDPKAAERHAENLAKAAREASARHEAFMQQQRESAERQGKLLEQLRAEQNRKNAEFESELARRQNARAQEYEEAMRQPPSAEESQKMASSNEWIAHQVIELRTGKKAVSALRLVQSLTYDSLSFEGVLGKRINVYGRIEKVDRDAAETPFILLQARGEIGAVKCSFQEADIGKLQGILGLSVVVEGQYDGITFGIVKLSGCKFTR